MKKYMIIILVFLLLLFLFTINIRATCIEKIIENHFSLASKGSVYLKNTTGHIQIFSWDKNEVKMVAIKSVSK